MWSTPTEGNIEKLHTGLCVDVVDPEVVGAFRNVIDSIVV
jgi:hypothetical protein